MNGADNTLNPDTPGGAGEPGGAGGAGGPAGPRARSNSRLPTTLNARDQPPAEVSDQRVSGLTGAVHGMSMYPEEQNVACDNDPRGVR